MKLDELPTEDERGSHVARLFREHNRMLVGLLVGRLKNEQEAKEVAQEAYVKLLQLDTAQGAVSYLRAYLFRIAENLAVDRLRQRRSRSRVDRLGSLDDFCEEPRAERAAIAQQELQLLRDAVDELPDRCREAFRLHKLEDRPLEEVAIRMGISERMVRKFITRALIYIRLRREGHSIAQARELLKA
ncbi:RNA polymerase sigma factor [Peristeroidobacter soli]|uniref:RNA polymerase sigma factor n=1 Tax=Peristeroidobacter soli TaxID=2497877 RepID=UPI00101B6410|nr:RNA polymerase sigma factor [Peristeroidobacter soli]